VIDTRRWIVAVGSALGVLVAASAQAAVIVDFTDSAKWKDANGATSWQELYGTFAVRVTSVNGSITFNAGEAPSTNPPCPPLKCNGDGLGIRDDEVTARSAIDSGEALTVSFFGGPGYTVPAAPSTPAFRPTPTSPSRPSTSACPCPSRGRCCCSAAGSRHSRCGDVARPLEPRSGSSRRGSDKRQASFSVSTWSR
jgi:hypothetical protein